MFGERVTKGRERHIGHGGEFDPDDLGAAGRGDGPDDHVVCHDATLSLPARPGSGSGRGEVRWSARVVRSLGRCEPECPVGIAGDGPAAVVDGGVVVTAEQAAVVTDGGAAEGDGCSTDAIHYRSGHDDDST